LPRTAFDPAVQGDLDVAAFCQTFREAYKKEKAVFG